MENIKLNIIKDDSPYYNYNIKRMADIKNREKEHLISFYMKIFIKATNVYNLKDSEYLHRPLTIMSNRYKIKVTEDKESISYRDYLLDNTDQNFLFSKFMKFHYGFLQFTEWYKKFDLKDIELDNMVIHEYISKKFYVCLEKSRRELGTVKISELDDYQLISKVCRNERLTLYNYLKLNKNSEATEMSNMTDQQIKDYINSEYIKIFKGKQYSKSKIPKEISQKKFTDLFEIYTKPGI